MKVKATQPFAHDSLEPRKGDVFEVNESLARELEKRGLVEIVQTKMVEKPQNKMASTPRNKSKAK